jgi:chromosome segregation ATPase
MQSNPLNDALVQLDSTIGSINARVNVAKENAKSYKTKIIVGLKDILTQLNDLSNNPAFTNIGRIQTELTDAKSALVQKTQELNDSQTRLSDANKESENLKTQLASCNQQITDITQNIADLQNQVGEQKTARERAEEQLNTLTEDKNRIEAELTQSQGQLSNIIERIATINNALISQIQLIDTIVTELDDTNGESVASQFEAVGSNIQAIINTLNDSGSSSSSGSSSGSSSSSSSSVGQKGNQTPRAKFTPVSPENLGFTWKGGRKSKKNRMKNRMKNRRQTNKKQSQCGGYTYSSVSRKLKDSSSELKDYSSATKSTKSTKSTKRH